MRMESYIMDTYKKFIKYYGPYKAVFFFDLLCAAFISIVDLAYPQILRTLTNTLFLKESSVILKNIFVIGGILLIFYILQALCKYYVSCQGHIMGAQMERDMRRELFEHYENLSFSYYDQNNTGQMMSRLVSDLFDISEFAHHGPENLFISVVKIIGSFIFLFIIQWKLALILSAVVLMMILFSARQNKRMQATFLDNRKRSVTSTQPFRILWPASGSYSPLPMKILNGKSFIRGMKASSCPSGITTKPWEPSRAAIRSFRVSCIW